VQYRSPLDKRQTRRVVIGRHGAPWTLQGARDEAKKLLAAVDLGRDPFAERKTEADRKRAETVAREEADRAEAEARRTGTFEQVVERFIELYHKPKNRAWRDVKLRLERDPVPAWRGRLLGDIRKADVVKLIDQVQARAPGTARSLFAYMRRLFGWAVERGEIEQSPMFGLRAPPQRRARDRVLTDVELRQVWSACDGLGHPFGPIIRLLMLTAQRRDEVASMRWDHIDLQAGVWILPAERCKNGKAHRVDLAPEAVAIIESIVRKGDFVFTTTGETAPSGFSHAKRSLDAAVAASGKAIPPWRLHDLRRTAATGMAALGHAPHVIERILNHISGAQGGLVAVYQHYQYRPERRQASLEWAAQVEAIVREKRASGVGIAEMTPRAASKAAC
ncbi:MAG: tyrosine-type recombinase/integrase, partial [Caulobacteraceae bacterium]